MSVSREWKCFRRDVLVLLDEAAVANAVVQAALNPTIAEVNDDEEPGEDDFVDEGDEPVRDEALDDDDENDDSDAMAEVAPAVDQRAQRAARRGGAP